MVPATSDDEEEQKRMNGRQADTGSSTIGDTKARRWSTQRNAYTLGGHADDGRNGPPRRSAEEEAAAAAGELERLYASGDVLPTLLTRGHLYAEHPPNVDELYEQYHRVSEEMEMGLLEEAGWESLEHHPQNKRGSGSKLASTLPPA